MTRDDIIQRVNNLKQQKAQNEVMLEQVKANLNAVHGAIQFAEELLRDGDAHAPEAHEDTDAR